VNPQQDKKHTKNMCEKYKKMGLAAAACTLLGINASQAAVTLTFSQAGADVTATWSGTYEVKENTSTSNLSPGAFIDFDYVGGHPGGSLELVPGGVFFASPLIQSFGSYFGTTFGYTETIGVFPTGTALGDVLTPVGTMTFPNVTLADLGADSLSMFLAYTGAGNVDESSKIYLTTAGSVSAIPEPSGVVGVAGLLAGGLLIRRRKRGCGRG
jgi:hypothetical protein